MRLQPSHMTFRPYSDATIATPNSYSAYHLQTLSTLLLAEYSPLWCASVRGAELMPKAANYQQLHVVFLRML